MDRFFRGIGDRIRGTNSAEERAEAVPEAREEPEGFWAVESDFGTADVAARTSAATDNQAEDSADDSDVDAGAFTDDVPEDADDESDDNDSDTTETPSEELTISADGDDDTILTGGIVSDGSGTVTIGTGGSESITLSDGSGSSYDETPGVQVNVDEHPDPDSRDQAVLDPVDPEPPEDDDTNQDGGGSGGWDPIRSVDGTPADFGRIDLSDIARQAAQDSGQQAQVIGQISPEDLRVSAEFSSRADLSSYLSDSDDDDDDDDQEVPRDYLIEKPNVELQRDPSLFPSNPQPKAGEDLDVLGNAGAMSAEFLPSSTEGSTNDLMSPIAEYLPSSVEGATNDLRSASLSDVASPTAEFLASSVEGATNDLRSPTAEFLPSSTEGVSNDLKSAQFGEMEGLWPRGEQMQAEASGFTATDDLWVQGQTGSPANLVEELGSDVFLKGEQTQVPGFMAGGLRNPDAETGSLATEGYTATDDLWVHGNKVSADFMAGGLKMEDVGKAQSGESGQDTGDYQIPGGIVPPPVAQAAPQYAEMSSPDMINSEVEILGLVEEPGSDVFLKAEDGGPVEATGYTATDDLWVQGSGEKLEFMTGLKMEDVGKDGLQAESGESGQAGWNPTPDGSYGVVDPSAVGKEVREPEPVMVEGTAVAASDLEFTMPDLSVDEMGGKESGLEGILTPIPEPDYSLGPAPNPPDPVDKENFLLGDDQKQVGLQNPDPMVMDPYSPDHMNDARDWWDEQGEQASDNNDSDQDDGDDPTG